MYRAMCGEREAGVGAGGRTLLSMGDEANVGFIGVLHRAT